MFDNNSRLELEETIAYERWVLSNVIEVMQRHLGNIDSIQYVFDENDQQAIDTISNEEFGLRKSNDLIHDLSPLLFASAFKVLDMIMEWIIREDNGYCPWKFKQKIDLLKTQTFSLPYPLDKEPSIFDYCKALYKEMAEYRNALTHGKWGNNQQGDLQFDFQKNGQHYLKTISFNEVITFSDFFVVLAKTAVSPSALPGDVCSKTLKLSLDGMASLHGNPKFGVQSPRFYFVIKRLADGVRTVDLKKITDSLGGFSPGLAYEYLLRIESREIWEIPSIELNNVSTLNLDGIWDKYKI